MSHKRPQALKHAHVDDSFTSPTHGSVERIHTPHRGNPHADMSVEDWDHEKHAHLDGGIVSPHGVVKRTPTPRCDDRAAGASAFDGAAAPGANAIRDRLAAFAVLVGVVYVCTRLMRSNNSASSS